MTTITYNLSNLVRPFEKKWVALRGDDVVASGHSVTEVKQKAEKLGLKEYSFYFVPSSSASLAPFFKGSRMRTGAGL